MRLLSRAITIKACIVRPQHQTGARDGAGAATGRQAPTNPTIVPNTATTTTTSNKKKKEKRRDGKKNDGIGRTRVRVCSRRRKGHRAHQTVIEFVFLALLCARAHARLLVSEVCVCVVVWICLVYASKASTHATCVNCVALCAVPMLLLHLEDYDCTNIYTHYTIYDICSTLIYPDCGYTIMRSYKHTPSSARTQYFFAFMVRSLTETRVRMHYKTHTLLNS